MKLCRIWYFPCLDCFCVIGKQNPCSQGSFSIDGRVCEHKEVAKTSQQIKLNSAGTTEIGLTLCQSVIYNLEHESCEENILAQECVYEKAILIHFFNFRNRLHLADGFGVFSWFAESIHGIFMDIFSFGDGCSWGWLIQGCAVWDCLVGAADSSCYVTYIWGEPYQPWGNFKLPWTSHTTHRSLNSLIRMYRLSYLSLCTLSNIGGSESEVLL